MSKIFSKKKNPRFKKVLVTGGAGYVGVPLAELLLDRGYGVRILDMLRYGPESVFHLFGRKGFEFMKGDVRRASDAGKAVSGIDAVVHLAAIVGYPACRKDPKLSRSINVGGTKTLLARLPKRVPVFFASTTSNYGKLISDLCAETTPLNPLTDYGRQKTEAEELVKKRKEFVIFRFATAFGVASRLRLDVLPNDFAYRAVRERTLIVYEKDFVRTFIHVRDMARAFLFALEHYPAMRGEAYNVGDSRLTFSKEEICRLLQRKADYYLHFADVGHDLDQRNYEVSYDKIARLGFRTSVSMDEGLDELVAVAKLLELKNNYYGV